MAHLSRNTAVRHALPARWMVLLMLVTGWLAGPARVSLAGSAELRILGSRTASVDIVVTRTMRLDNNDTVRATMTGRYAGYEIRRLPGLEVLAGSVRLAEWDYGGVLMGYSEPVLTPGRYRVSLLVERGSADLRIPVRSGPGLTLRPTRPSGITAKLVDLHVVAGLPVATGRTALEVRTKSTMISQAMGIEYQVGALYAQDRICIASRGKNCDENTPGGHGGGTGVLGLYSNHNSYPGTIPPGSYDAVYEAQGLAPSKRQEGFLYVSP